MLKAPDAGDIVGQKEVGIEFEDTAYTLYQKLCGRARDLLEEALPLIKKGNAPRVAQNLSQGSYYGGRKPEDGKIDWNWPVMRDLQSDQGGDRTLSGSLHLSARR